MKKLLICLLGLTLLTGCQKTTEQASTSGYALDNYGRTIHITQKPSKVLTLGPNCSELFCALGLDNYIIGNTLDNHSRGPLEEYKEVYNRIPELNYSSATRESVLSSGADFIYGIDWEFGDEALDVDELTQFGMTTYMNKASTLEQIYQEITDLGRIFEIEDKAKAFIDDQKSRIQKVNDLVSKQEPIKVLVYDSGGNGVFTCSGSNFETLLIEQAGGKNIFDDLKSAQWVTVSQEEVLKRDPEVILIHDYDSPSLEEKIKEIKNDPALSKLDCVKQERFVSISLESVLPGDRMAYTVEYLAKGFYPDLFKGSETNG